MPQSMSANVPQAVARHAATADAARVTTIGFSDEGLGLIDTTTTQKVGVRLINEHSTKTKHYGTVLGYFNGLVAVNSQVVNLTHGDNVTFKNVDSVATHTVSFLGDATANSAPFPPSFNGSATKSKAGTVVETKNFSTGPLNPGQTSAVYSVGAPGFYMIGCAFHYDSNGMRTVIIVH